MIQGGLAAFRGKNVLMLQGPVGPFFSRMAEDLRTEGAQVTQVALNGGDWVFSGPGTICYRGTPEDWPAFLEALIVKRHIDVIFLYGDCRPIHQPARDIARERDLEVGVFEEGYIRPDHITLERHGVNGNSSINRDPSFHTNSKPIPKRHVKTVGNAFRLWVLYTILYYTAAVLLWPFFRHYRHHRPLSWMDAGPWLRALWRRYAYAWTERHYQKRLVGSMSKDFFLVPLQVQRDAQVLFHSHYSSVEGFAHEVMRSFAEFAPQDTYLVIKHHPMDRGYHDYTKTIQRKAQELNIEGRVIYLHDQHLPTLLRHARGVVVINSTVGLSAVHHGAPLKVCGRAIYDMPGLTYQGALDAFWNDAPGWAPNPKLYRRFRGYLIENTQLNGSFYKRLEGEKTFAGIVWRDPPALVFEPTPFVPLPILVQARVPSRHDRRPVADRKRRTSGQHAIRPRAGS